VKKGQKFEISRRVENRERKITLNETRKQRKGEMREIEIEREGEGEERRGWL